MLQTKKFEIWNKLILVYTYRYKGGDFR